MNITVRKQDINAGIVVGNGITFDATPNAGIQIEADPVWNAEKADYAKLTDLGDATSIRGKVIDDTVPSDGKILVYRTVDDKYILEDKPISGANPSAADVSFTPAGDISSINVQDAIVELDNEKISKGEAIAFSIAL